MQSTFSVRTLEQLCILIKKPQLLRGADWGPGLGTQSNLRVYKDGGFPLALKSGQSGLGL